MAQTPEGKVKAGIKALLHSRGVWFCMPMGTGFGSSGVPDFVCCHHGRFLAIEAKAPRKRNNTSALQKLQIEGIRATGGVALVVDDPNQLKEFFENEERS